MVGAVVHARCVYTYIRRARPIRSTDTRGTEPSR